MSEKVKNDTKLTEELEKVRRYAEKYAEKRGDVVLNPDPETRETVLEGLARMRLKFGKQYCPCRVLCGNVEEDRKKVCPCAWLNEELAKHGICHCRLFVKK